MRIVFIFLLAAFLCNYTHAVSFDTTPEVFANTANGKAFSLTGISNGNTIYYVVVNNGVLPAPTAADIAAGTAAGGGIAIANGNVVNDLNNIMVTAVGINLSTNYDIYLVAENSGSYSSIYALDVFTSNGLPYFSVAPTAQSITDTSYIISGRLNETGTVHYISTASATPPIPPVDAFQVKTESASNTNSTVVSASTFSIQVTGLTPGTNHYVYVVGEDNDNQLSSILQSFVVTTLPDAAPEFINGPIQTATSATGLSVSGELDKEGQVYFLVLDDGAPAPSASAVIDAASVASASTSPFIFSIPISGKVPSTSYDMYFVTRNNASNQDSSVSQLDVATINALPVLSGLATTNVDDIAFDLNGSLDEDGTIYYVVLENGDPTPTDIEIRDASVTNITSGSLSVSAAVAFNTRVNGLSINTAYDIHVVGKDTLLDLSLPMMITSSTALSDTFTPTFTNSTPSTSNLSDTSVDLDVSISESGSFSYLLVDAAATAPDANEVLALVDYGGTTVYSSAQTTVPTANQIVTLTLGSLIPGTTYALYIVAQDNALNATSVQNINFTTSDTIAPVFTTAPSATSTWTISTINVAVDEAHRLYWVVVADGATAPSSAEVQAETASAGAAALFTGNDSSVQASGIRTIVINTLSPDTDYDLYLVAEDSASSPNLMASAVLVNISTLPATQALVGEINPILVDGNTVISLGSAFTVTSAIIHSDFEQPPWITMGIVGNNPQIQLSGTPPGSVQKNYRVKIQISCQENGGAVFSFTRTITFIGLEAATLLAPPTLLAPSTLPPQGVN